jgi:hypothetical protein
VKGKKRVIRIHLPGAALLLLVVLMLLTACTSSGSSNTPGQSTATVVVQATSTPAPPPTPTPRPHYKVGDQAQVGNSWLVTITSAVISSGDSAYQPQEGNRYLVIDVTQQNQSSQALSVNSQTEWVLRDGTGQSYALVMTDYGEPPNGTIDAGASQQGQLVYEVPSSEGQFTLTFASTGGSEQAIWDIQV